MSESKEEYIAPEIHFANRRAALVRRLVNVPLSEFKVGQLVDIILVHDEKAVFDGRHADLSKALDRLEKFLDERAYLGKPSLPG